MRGGHVEGGKVTEEIAKIRSVVPFTTINSPNRFKEFEDYPPLFDFVDKIRNHTGKPVGSKLVLGGQEDAAEWPSFMLDTGLGPDLVSFEGPGGGGGHARPRETGEDWTRKQQKRNHVKKKYQPVRVKE